MCVCVSLSLCLCLCLCFCPAVAAVAAVAAPAKFINNTNIPPSVGSSMPQQPYVTNTSFNQLTPPPTLKGGLRNSRMR